MYSNDDSNLSIEPSQTTPGATPTATDIKIKGKRTNPVEQLQKFCADIGMEECFALFEKQGCDISYVEDFCDETLITDIGIDSTLKRKKFLRECAKFCVEMK